MPSRTKLKKKSELQTITGFELTVFKDLSIAYPISWELVIRDSLFWELFSVNCWVDIDIVGILTLSISSNRLPMLNWIFMVVFSEILIGSVKHSLKRIFNSSGKGFEITLENNFIQRYW